MNSPFSEKALARAVTCLLDFSQGIVVNVDGEMVVIFKDSDGSLKMTPVVTITTDVTQHWHGNVINMKNESRTLH
jgi:hypothetical protein